MSWNIWKSLSISEHVTILASQTFSWSPLLLRHLGPSSSSSTAGFGRRCILGRGTCKEHISWNLPRARIGSFASSIGTQRSTTSRACCNGVALTHASHGRSFLFGCCGEVMLYIALECSNTVRPPKHESCAVLIWTRF